VVKSNNPLLNRPGKNTAPAKLPSAPVSTMLVPPRKAPVAKARPYVAPHRPLPKPNDPVLALTSSVLESLDTAQIDALVQQLKNRAAAMQAYHTQLQTFVRRRANKLSK